jgi:tetratricopeptide (TPR) repeat protein
MDSVVPTMKIFISSPSDLSEERDAIKRVLEDLNNSPTYEARLKLLPFAYEDHAPALVGKGAQNIIDEHMLPVEDADIVICMFWLRMGTPTPDLINPATNQPYQSGTEYEFLTAYEALQRQGMPQILLYRCIRPPQDLLLLDVGQYAAVEAFFRRFSSSDTFKGLIGQFRETSELERKVRAALEKLLSTYESRIGFRQPPLPPEPNPNAWIRPWNLPPRASKLVGRENVLEQLCERLRAEGSQRVVVAITGMAGVGKSSLAAETVHVLATDQQSFPLGITWVRCDDRQGPAGLIWIYDQLLAAWGGMLTSQHVPQNSASEVMLDMRETALRARLAPGTTGSYAGHPVAPNLDRGSALIFLDNVEQGLPIDRAIDTLSALGCALVLTVRHEPSNPRIDLVRLDVPEAQAAHDLFVAQFLKRGGDWSTWRDDEAVMAVVDALGRLPLAIELAAARAVRIQTGIAALAQDLQEANRLPILADPLDPKQSVRHAFVKSLECLDELQRARFAALGLLAGADWPRAVVEHMFHTVTTQTLDPGKDHDAETRSHGRSPSEDLDALTALSFITSVPSEEKSLSGSSVRSARQVRIRIHPLLYDLAREELSQTRPALIRRVALKGLLDGIVSYMHSHANDPFALGRDEALIIGALRDPDAQATAPRQIVDAIDGVWSYLDTCCRWHQGVDLLKVQLYLRRQLNDMPGVGVSLTRLGLLSRNIGHTRNARRYFQDALEIHRASNNRVGEGDTLNHLGVLARNAGSPDQAARYYELALLIEKEANNAAGTAWTLTNVGVLRAQFGDVEAASQCFQDALVMHKDVGDLRGESVVLNGLGNIARKARQWEQAEKYFYNALAISRSIGDRTSEGVTLSHLGNLARNLGHSEQAHQCYQESLSIHRETGDLAGEGWALTNLGVLWRDVGQRDNAFESFRTALTLFTKMEAFHAVRIVQRNIRQLRTAHAKQPNSRS